MNHQDPTHDGEEHAAEHLEQQIQNQIHHNKDVKGAPQNTHRLQNQ